ncbi:hypothetical protein D0C36_18530 [Mucilaginibacter conchicola]|uniref:Uncharacterized protein n=1 Tax=Mucilaginibacter conchicola TaxID=2303333 RepID=A0A372NRP6_9SPHI|nr:hypothetical protein D0C36_18530 [Mucilaginibacter conchicola]
MRLANLGDYPKGNGRAGVRYGALFCISQIAACQNTKTCKLLGLQVLFAIQHVSYAVDRQSLLHNKEPIK